MHEIRAAVVRQYEADLADAAPVVLEALKKAFPDLQAVLRERLVAVDVTRLDDAAPRVLYVMPDGATYAVQVVAQRVDGSGCAAGASL